MKSFFFFLTIFFTFLFFAPKNIFASSDFLTSYDVTYTVRENGITHVLISIALKNTTSKYYASSYKLNLGFENIDNLIASDPDGKIEPKITKTNIGSDIELDLNTKVVGIDKILNFDLSFDTKEVAKRQGTIWEINIPGIINQENFSDFNVHVKVPSQFGQPSYIKPPLEVNGLNFTKQQLGKSGISIGFGDKQTYKFKLSYHLKNTKIFPIKTEIALPPSTNYQNVFIEDIDPKPSNVVEDQDGNWLAQYYLSPSQKMDIKVSGISQVFLNPKKEILSDTILSDYLKEKQYWELSDYKIKKLAKDLGTPLAIYEYVVKSLNYDFSRVTSSQPRLGAKNVLNNPTSAVCLEFTDLFVTLARAAGIPAREVDGFAYTQNEKQRPLSLVKDVLHAWPEYYDKNLQAWVMIDPTWGNTTNNVDYFSTLDFDHFAFVIKGQNSGYPIPAGGYKLPGEENIKDVDVGFADLTIDDRENFEIKLDMQNSFLSAMPITGKITLKNTGGSILKNQSVNVESLSLLPKVQSVLFGEIPPFGSVIKEFSIDQTPILTNTLALIKISIAGKTISQTIKISPFFLSKWSIIGGILIATIFTFILSIIIRRVWRLFVPRRKQ